MTDKQKKTLTKCLRDIGLKGIIMGLLPQDEAVYISNIESGVSRKALLQFFLKSEETTMGVIQMGGLQ